MIFSLRGKHCPCHLGPAACAERLNPPRLPLKPSGVSLSRMPKALSKVPSRLPFFKRTDFSQFFLGDHTFQFLKIWFSPRRRCHFSSELWFSHHATISLYMDRRVRSTGRGGTKNHVFYVFFNHFLTPKKNVKKLCYFGPRRLLERTCPFSDSNLAPKINPKSMFLEVQVVAQLRLHFCAKNIPKNINFYMSRTPFRIVNNRSEWT